MHSSTILVLVLLLLVSQVSADAPRMNLDIRWSSNAGETIGDIELADGDGNGKKEIYVGLANTTVLIINQFGEKKGEFTIGNSSQIGRIYSMAAADLNGDGKDELIFGLGGAKEVRQYTATDFDIDPVGLGITTKDKSLFRVIRYHGGVYVMAGDGRIMWRYLTLDSVKKVTYVPVPDRIGHIAAGVGDLVIYTYHERTDEPVSELNCAFEWVEDDVSGWGTYDDCTNKACEGLKRCIPSWDDECIDDRCEKGHPDPDKCYRWIEDDEGGGVWDICPTGTQDTCYISYDKYVCGEDVEGKGREYVDYKELNGTVVFLDKGGRFLGDYKLSLKTDKGEIVANADNTIADMVPVDMDGDGLNELVVSSNNGEFINLNITNVSAVMLKWSDKIAYLMDPETSEIKWEYGSQVKKVNAGNINDDEPNEVIAGTSEGIIVTTENNGNLIWKQRVDDSITGIDLADIEGNEIKDIIITSRDGTIYVYDAAGNLKWDYTYSQPIYGLKVIDFGKNELQDFILYTTTNVTRLEMNEFYIKKYRADTYYNTAYDAFMAGDYTSASIYVDKAVQLYKSIDDRGGIPKCNLLRARIDEEFKLRNKAEADRYYNLALKYYSLNELDAAIGDVNKAKKIYQSLEDEEGVIRCDSLLETIKDEVRLQKKLIADGHYSKANSLANFGNYTGALELLDKAKMIYEEINYFNGTVQCDIMVLRIADKHYLMAESAFKTKDYQTALSYALLAQDLYTQVGSYNASYNAAELARLANESIGKQKQSDDSSGDYRIYVIGAIVLILVVIIYMKLQSLRVPRKPPDMSESEEEIRILEQEE